MLKINFYQTKYLHRNYLKQSVLEYLPNMLNRRRKQLAKIAFLHFRK